MQKKNRKEERGETTATERMGDRKEEKGEITKATESLPNVGPSESDVEPERSEKLLYNVK